MEDCIACCPQVGLAITVPFSPCVCTDELGISAKRFVIAFHLTVMVELREPWDEGRYSELSYHGALMQPNATAKTRPIS
ncbi:hypothetical protein Y032_0033g2628 [Ancylostoma ceylanicum]|uniref:Uncharacterized protein n=1 Tax=Ancylostoma ceylanicum TaxID=53326 RepID=A0A016UMG2_9BILA|nr:hypothetical protein Y032_0033g2628 [Ancylostoma ceylanicum]